ncbi:ATP-binding protein [Archaeoglobus veneficus]|uniref:AAA ATPase central domain protein n=1 Tax=Archaeoglobus veneficus (strain DSM 11195 / SNP6) TaxID=693661 RepID=F2KRU0_ARCVS|nr:ATP-binding protein [Archaeoglobus veneficus]AEA47954.1 AAA ATPase central domain protein [Archaeoglobus veneficus SNP6]
MLKLVELILTAEIYNRFSELTEDDIPKEIRKIFYGRNGISRPLVVKLDAAKRIGNVDEVLKLPFIDLNTFTKQFVVTSFDAAVKWFASKAEAVEHIRNNPVLAYFYQNYDSLNVSYEEAKKRNEPKHSDREWLRSVIAELEKSPDTAEMLGLVRIYSPEDIKVDFSDVALDSEQIEEIRKIEVAMEERSYLKRIGLTDIGKLLFIGPPGTGKTTTARALSRKLCVPLVEVKLSMITSQYLGETSKNIEKVFEIAKKLNPCILFIDEFDYVAKTRTSDEHAAVKRAVNTLLKSIDEINLIEDGVILIAATNHPSLLDPAVWRRFDKIVEFPEPPESVRKKIFELALSKVEGSYDIDELVKLTDGFTGAEIKLVVREAVLKALLRGEKKITQQDLLEAVEEVKGRLCLKTSY